LEGAGASYEGSGWGWGSYRELDGNIRGVWRYGGATISPSLGIIPKFLKTYLGY